MNSQQARNIANKRWSNPNAHRRIDTFWRNVAKSGQNECWLWRGIRNTKGYGAFSMRDRKTSTAHRLMYEISNGPIPTGMECAHRCHNRLCVNPEHLVLMTHSENMLHSAKDGRLPCQVNPELTNLRKLDRAEVFAIRSSDEHREMLAARYGVHPDTISNIKKRRTWKHI